MSTLHVFSQVFRLLTSSSHPFLSAHSRFVLSCAPYCLRSKLLPASRRGPQCPFAPSLAQCTHHRATRPAPRTPLALARFPQLRQLGVGPGHAILCLPSCSWCQVGPRHAAAATAAAAAAVTLPLTLCLGRQREAESSRLLLYEQIASERLKRTQSTYTHPQPALLT